MGDIKRFRKKYTTPSHPWNATRILLEKSIARKYGVGNKKEIWKMESALKGFKDQAKSLLTRTDDQANKERTQMIARIVRLGLVGKDAGVDDILGLQLKDIMDRRLQTIVLKRRLARSIKHARQLITHEHITVGGKKVTSPSYLVLAEEEKSIGYSADSAFMRQDHPEGYDEEVAQRRYQRQAAKAHRKGEQVDEIVMFDASDVEDPEEVKHAAAPVPSEGLSGETKPIEPESAQVKPEKKAAKAKKAEPKAEKSAPEPQKQASKEKAEEKPKQKVEKTPEPEKNAEPETAAKE